jgi:polysaccharide biosynthesis protein PslG
MFVGRGQRTMTWVLLLGLLLPLLIACGGPTEPAASPVASSSASAEPSVAASEPSASVEPSADASDAPSAEPSPSADGASESPTASESAAPSEGAGAGEGSNSNIPTRLEYGAVSQLYYTDADRVLKLTEIGGFDWVRQQVPWKDTEPPDRTFGFQELDKVVDTVAAYNRKLMLSVVKSPDWATGRPGDNGLPQNPEDYARFVRELATRYKGKLHAIEVWNEQNLAVENGGRVVPEDAARYVELLKLAYTAIKDVDPSIVVVVGALSSSGDNDPARAVDDITYYKAMYDYNNGEITNYMDAQGFHPASTLNPPDTLYPEVPGPGCEMEPKQWCEDRTHYFRHIEDVRAVMVEYGLADKQIWVTEMGWATENNSPGYEYGNYVSLEQQADYLEGALFRTLTNYDYVGVVFIWNLNFAVTWGQNGNPLHEQASFGLLNPDYSPRPSFSRIQGFINAARNQ